jgi:hypothetical protein
MGFAAPIAQRTAQPAPKSVIVIDDENNGKTA